MWRVKFAVTVHGLSSMTQPPLFDHRSLLNWLLVQTSSVTLGLMVVFVPYTTSFSCLVGGSWNIACLLRLLLSLLVLQTTLTTALILMLPPRSKETCVQA